MRNIILIFTLVLVFPVLAAAQGNGFNFQGRLNDGTNPANGNYDLQFSLFNTATAGTQIGTTIARPNITLINGVFSVTLDFGATAFNNPNSIFIEISVKPNGSPNAFTILGPRQQLTVVPFSVRAMNATNADNAVNAQNSFSSQNAVLATNALNARNADNSDTLDALNSTDFIRNSVSPQANQNFNIVGNGVINGTLNVAGNTVNGGNVQQNRNSNGLVKAMVFVNANGTIARCYNGITGATTGNCGFTPNRFNTGNYTVDFGFQVNDRFVSVSPQKSGGSVNIGATFDFGSAVLPDRILVRTWIPDVTYNDSTADNPFMIVVY